MTGNILWLYHTTDCGVLVDGKMNKADMKMFGEDYGEIMEYVKNLGQIKFVKRNSNSDRV